MMYVKKYWQNSDIWEKSIALVWLNSNFVRGRSSTLGTFNNGDIHYYS